MGNKQTYQFNNDNEWYTFKKDVRDFMEISNIPTNKIIWLPFDNDESAFVKVLTELGYTFINSHIDQGKSFFTYEPNKYDVIISNPPFKGKAKILERLKELNKPFALIFGIQCFSSGEFTRKLKDFINIQLVFLTRRIKFHKGVEDIKLPAPTFHSLWICDRVMNQKITILESGKYE